MLFDEGKNYKKISNEVFNNDLERFKGTSDIVGTIYYFFKDSAGNVKMIERNNKTNFQIEQNLRLLCKYYVIRVKIDEPLCFQFEDTGYACQIYNLGSFYISSLYEMNNENKQKIKELFENYEKNYNILSFPWSDEEFLLKYNKRNR